MHNESKAERLKSALRAWIRDPPGKWKRHPCTWKNGQPTQRVHLENGSGVGLSSWNAPSCQSQWLLPLSFWGAGPGGLRSMDCLIASSSKSWVPLGNDAALRQSSKQFVLQEVPSPGMPPALKPLVPLHAASPAASSPLAVVQSALATCRGSRSFSCDTSAMVATSLGSELLGRCLHVESGFFLSGHWNWPALGTEG